MNNTSKVILGVIGGMAVGAIAGVLYAPASGKKTRKDLSDKVDSLKNQIAQAISQGEDYVSEKVSDMRKQLAEIEKEMENIDSV